MRLHHLALVLALPCSACTVTRVGSGDGPARVEADGLIEGHAAVGIPEEDDFFRLQLLDGQSPGALAEVALWKLFRLEVGALGVGLGLGPIDLGIGTFFYHPEVPPMGGKQEPVAVPSSAEDCAICAAAKAAQP